MEPSAFHKLLILSQKILLQTLKIGLIIYIIACVLLYFFQEKLIFLPSRLDRNYRFQFNLPFEEVNIKTGDGIFLNSLLFKAANSKGLIFYLHGNAGSLESWGDVAKTYTALQYDVFILDYRGYGKSEGSISSQSQIYKDVQTAYDTMKARYSESKMIVLGYSIGTGPAAKLASANSPKMLILQAPYYSLTDMMKDKFPFIPTFLLKYKFATNEYLESCKMQVVIFHGNEDEVIPYQSSIQLKPLLKPGDTLITLDKQGHNGITENEDYKNELKKLLL